MKIFQIALGTRGDMDPPLAIAKLLNARGHQVVCLFPEQFCSLAKAADVDYISLGSEWHEFMQENMSLFTDAAIPWWTKLAAIKRLNREGNDIHEKIAARIHLHVSKANPDKILYSAKGIFAAIYGVEQPGRVIFHCPLPYMHYAKGHAHVGFKGKDLGTWLNKLSYWLVDSRVSTLLVKSAKRLGIPGIAKAKVKQVLAQQKVIYTLSPTLFQRPEDWPNNIKVLGYNEKAQNQLWQPSEQVQSLLNNNDKVLFVTFGSMTNNNAQQHTQMLLAILQRNGIAAIINTFSGGLQQPQDWQDDSIVFVDEIPYDWAFSRVFAVMHHGGAGTLHMATKHACPSLIIPHAVDQFVWNDLVAEQQLGPKGITMGKIKETELEQKILDLFTNPLYQKHAAIAAQKMAEESYLEQTLCDNIIS